MPAVLVRLHGVAKTYGPVRAVNEVSLEVFEGEFLTLLGPSGSGKTTMLMLIAGFEQPSHGEIQIRGASVVAQPPHRRDIGMMFQSYALFPHMTVFDNVAFPLRARKTAGHEVEARVREVLEIVRLPNIERRYPRQLSGGQQQRVALARAIAYRPSLLLMDEPLGALDRKLREEMQLELKTIQRELGVTTLYVTHDQQEALALSDRVAIMNHGDLVQIGAPVELYESPADDFVAGFLGDVNLLEGVTRGSDGGITQIGVGPFTVAVQASGLDATGKTVRLAVRPERLRLEAGPATATAPTFPGTAWPGVVRDTVFQGEFVRYTVVVGETIPVKVVQPYSGPHAMLAPGQSVVVVSAARDWRVIG